MSSIIHVNPCMATIHLISLGVLKRSYANDLALAQKGDAEAKVGLSTALRSIADISCQAYEKGIDDYSEIEGIDRTRLAEAAQNPLESSVRFFSESIHDLGPNNLSTIYIAELAELALNEGGEVGAVDSEIDRMFGEYHLSRFMTDWIFSKEDKESFLAFYTMCLGEIMPSVMNPVVARSHLGMLLYLKEVMDFGEGFEAAKMKGELPRYAGEVGAEILSGFQTLGKGGENLFNFGDEEFSTVYTNTLERIRGRVTDAAAHEIAINTAILQSIFILGDYERWAELTTDTFVDLRTMLEKTEIKGVAGHVALLASLDEYSSIAFARKRALQYKDAIVELARIPKSMGIPDEEAIRLAGGAFTSTTTLTNAREDLKAVLRMRSKMN